MTIVWFRNTVIINVEPLNYESMTTIILLIDDSVHKFFGLVELLTKGNPDVRVFSSLKEEEVLKVLKENSVDIIIMEPVLPVSFLKPRKIRVRKPENGEVGLILVESIMKKLYRAVKKPKIIFNTQLSPERLVQTGFKKVKGSHLPKPATNFQLVQMMERKLRIVSSEAS